MDLHARSARQDVRELGAVLGDAIRAQTSAAALETVESLRTTAIEYRRGDLESFEHLHDLVVDLDDDMVGAVARAFTTYFELINLAEERERVRALRDAGQAGTLTDGLASAIERFDGEVDVATVERILDDVHIAPTFTAHPTEARRKTVKSKLRSISRHLEELDERRLTDDEYDRLWRHVVAEVTSLWQTPQVRHRAPEPQDEARNVQWYLENTLFDVIGDVYGELEVALDEHYPGVEVPTLVEFRSWAGSDRDGNPYVTPEVTADTLARQRRVALAKYRDALGRLSGILSQDGDRIDVGPEMERSLEADRDRFPSVASTAADRYLDEPYRQKLRLMRERLDRVDDVRPGGYLDAGEFVADLEVIADSLRANDAGAVVGGHGDPVIRRVETFGFTLASLDVRDHRENHTAAVAKALAPTGIEYADMDEDERVSLLTEAILQDDPVIDVGETAAVSETTARVLRRFEQLAAWQREYGVDAIDTYCISMTEDPSHVLEVLFLADQAGVVALPDHCGLDVVPLLETESALNGARRIMGVLFENEAYARALDLRDGVQEVMLGYSDSNKENGFLAANWDLYTNQRNLAAIAADHDVELRLFHGRGGSISRGGGPMNDALLALPTETVTGPVKFTEQGEAIAEKYANPAIAERNIEQMLNAQLRARRRALENPETRVPTAWLRAMDVMATAARTAYRDLLEADGFVRYFEQATPITVIEELNLGSRPASRTGERTVEDLRAIPWVFSWTQSRCILPGWYALATGIDAYLEDGGDVETLQAMYEEWPFFATTIDNAALSLARTDLRVAAEYAALADEDLADRFLPRIEAEYDRAVEHVLAVTGRDGLLTRAWLEESLARRNPYVDPLNVLQTRLLSREDRTPEEEQFLRLTVKGIAAGMKNTG